MLIGARKRVLLFGGFGIVLLLVSAFAWTSYGQFGQSKYTSPPANVAATIAGKKIAIEYYAPSAHGRKIMGGLVPFGEVWCTGANWATKITTEAPLQMGTLKLPAGSYSIWTLPNANEWTLIINKQTGQFHKDYNSSTDFGRTKMNLKTLAAPVETFKIDLRSDGGNQGTLAWIGRRRKRQSLLQSRSDPAMSVGAPHIIQLPQMVNIEATLET